MRPAQVNPGTMPLSAVQGTALLVGFAVLALVLSARLANGEAPARRPGLFLYLSIAVMVVGLFVVALLQTDAQLFEGSQ